MLRDLKVRVWNKINLSVKTKEVGLFHVQWPMKVRIAMPEQPLVFYKRNKTLYYSLHTSLKTDTYTNI